MKRGACLRCERSAGCTEILMWGKDTDGTFSLQAEGEKWKHNRTGHTVILSLWCKTSQAHFTVVNLWFPFLPVKVIAVSLCCFQHWAELFAKTNLGGIVALRHETWALNQNEPLRTDHLLLSKRGPLDSVSQLLTFETAVTLTLTSSFPLSLIALFEAFDSFAYFTNSAVSSCLCLPVNCLLRGKTVGQEDDTELLRNVSW